MKEVEGRIYSNILRFYELGLESPADLVATFEIIEMNNEYITRRTRQLNSHKNSHNSKNESISKATFVGGIKVDVLYEFVNILSQKIEGIFETAKLSNSYDDNRVKCILDAGLLIYLYIYISNSSEVIN